MKYLLLVFLTMSSFLTAKEVRYMYYKDPMAVPEHSYGIDCSQKECKKEYIRIGDVGNIGPPTCWCSKYKIFKLKILNELHDAEGKPFCIVSRNNSKPWIIYANDENIVKFETRSEK